jgi:lipoprotein-anchoring transpeptidase ErfK/SrfK
MKVRLPARPIAVLLAGAVVAVAAFSTSASGAGGPAASTPPTVAGAAKSGETLTVTPGTWASAPTSVAYAWQRCSNTGSSCAAIDGAAGATATTYVLTSADVGQTVRVVETATDAAYVLVVADNGKSLRLSVTAKNTPGSDTQTSAPTATVVALNPPSVVTLPSGAKSIDAGDVHAPAAQLIIDRVSFSPNPLRSRAAFAARIHISDSRGYSVRNALVFVEGLPFGRSSTPAEVKTGSDGTATLTLIPTSKLPLQQGATLVMFVRARVAGDRLIAGASARRLVNLLVVPS